MNRLFMGCIADDYTGATDLASMIAKSGMSVIQSFGIPENPGLLPECDALVIALKTRSITSSDAIMRCVQACRFLESQRASRFFFKYCSTFDSTPTGNIGPVAEALSRELNVQQTIFCPAFPENQRTVYRGHLFVGDALLNECGMQHHPLTPMTDANLIRVLGAQSEGHVSLLRHDALQGSPSQVRQRLDGLDELVVTDAIENHDLERIAEVVADDRLVTGGSAIAGYLADTYVRRGYVHEHPIDHQSVQPAGPAAVLAGSCSMATLNQLAVFGQRFPWLSLEMRRIIDDKTYLSEVMQWVSVNASSPAIAISTSAEPGQLAEIHADFGREMSAQRAEEFLSNLGQHLVARGILRLVVAGGETSGSVIGGLGIQSIRIGREICAGVPWVYPASGPPLALVLKSGNFGGERFFLDALELNDR